MQGALHVPEMPYSWHSASSTMAATADLVHVGVEGRKRPGGAGGDAAEGAVAHVAVALAKIDDRQPRPDNAGGEPLDADGGKRAGRPAAVAAGTHAPQNRSASWPPGGRRRSVSPPKAAVAPPKARSPAAIAAPPMSDRRLRPGFWGRVAPPSSWRLAAEFVFSLVFTLSSSSSPPSRALIGAGNLLHFREAHPLVKAEPPVGI